MTNKPPKIYELDIERIMHMSHFHPAWSKRKIKKNFKLLYGRKPSIKKWWK